ncbi:homing endonuclease [Klebsiella phage vB_KpnM_KpS110]|uniref:Homing endonuclease n=1 Tax=Klebsiella phage vB_KpnM_KpS110 TaxID=2079262 RepID=A0A2K9VAD3_9CAUD|nr:homing endonuclease [Klebsiella phage vB_KpnM_KpS110]AUV59171.1 homing endonuclease [Klebsiella phage vB_KpnM_KpS110]
MAMYLVYQITNLINNKIYVGVHKGTPDDGYMGSGRVITRAILKYGLENFRKDILKVCKTSEEMYEEESRIVTQEFIDRDDTYNLTCGGYGSFTHINSDPLVRVKASEKALKTLNLKPKEELERIYKSRGFPGERNFWFGKNRSGKNNPRFGCTIDERTKEKIRASNKKLVEAGLVDYSNCKGPTTVEGKNAISKANAREFKFIDPEGNTVTIVNLAKFCKEHGLSEGSMGHVNKGRNLQHKGWRKA